MLNIQSLIDEVDTKISNMTKVHTSKTALLNEAINKIDEYQEMIDCLDIESMESVGAVLQKLSLKQRMSAKSALEELGTKALQYTLGPDYRMVIDMPENKKSKPEAFVLIHNTITNVYSDPLEQNGGGLIDVVSIALNIITLQTADPFIDGPIIMDEPFKMLSEEFIPMLCAFIQTIQRDFDRQIIIVTHNQCFAAEVSTRNIEVCTHNDDYERWAFITQSGQTL
ncbi:MAG: hypothetical protein RR420_01380 [Anaerovoracaceae bacterium]